MKKNYVIPIFIPHAGCPFSCVFCSQRGITGLSAPVPPHEIGPIVACYLKTIPPRGAHVELGFFGGSFTGIPMALQSDYLSQAMPFIQAGRLHDIRLSTRPDYIDVPILKNLKKHRVGCIELGIQSMSDDVLRASGRGHSSSDSKKASKMILNYGFRLGHQMMLGLPKSTFEKEIKTARLSVKLGAKQVRIYPTVVLKNSALFDMYKKGRYIPISEQEAIRRSAVLLKYFAGHGVRVIRCGLHPSDGLANRELVAGPYHPAFRQKVETYRIGQIFKQMTKKTGILKSLAGIRYNPSDTAVVIGHHRTNARMLESMFGKKILFADKKSIPGHLSLVYKNGKTGRVSLETTA